MRQPWRDLLLAALIAGVAATVLSLTSSEALLNLALADTDDAMRLVQAGDLVEGQGWADLTQHRLDPPGVAMHWTRHLDVLVAPFLLAAGPTTGGVAAALTVPTILLAALLGVLVTWFRRTPAAADRWLLVLVAIPMAAVASQFLPGRLDHHGLQILLAVAAAVSLLGGAWVGAGLLLGSSLAVGLDALPALLGLLVALGIGWTVDPGRWRDALWRVPLAAVAAVVPGTLLFGGDGRLWSQACDVFALPLLVAVATVGTGLVVVAPRPAATPRWRLAQLTLVGAGAVAAMAAVEPACLSGPLAHVPAEVADAWLSAVSEAQSFLFFLRREPLIAAGEVLPALVGLALTVAAVRRGDHRWLPLVGMLGGATTAVLIQMRAVSMAGCLALPTLSLLAEAVRTRTRSWPSPAASLGFVLVLVLGTGNLLVWAGALATEPEESAASRRECRRGEALLPLDAEPPGLVLADVDLGPFLLLHTPHAVLAAPYHRNVDGILAADDLLGGPSSAADLRRAGVDLVVVCPGVPANRLYLEEGSLMRRLLDGDVPAGLVPVTAEAIDLYRVEAPGAPP